MPNKYQFTILIVLLLTAFAIGRRSVESVSGNKQETIAVQQVQDVETKRTTTTVKKPNGEVKTVTVSDTVSTTKSDSSTKSSVTTKKSLNVSLFGGYNLYTPKPIYGLSVTKQVFGPVTVGAWGLNNGTLGVSVGLEF